MRKLKSQIDWTNRPHLSKHHSYIIKPTFRTRKNNSLPSQNITSVYLTQNQNQQENQPQSNRQKPPTKKKISILKKINKRESENYQKVFKLQLKQYVMEVFIAYCIAVLLIYVSSMTNFPFFEVIMVLIISSSLKPLKITNVIILFGIPMAIANTYLKVQIFTYIQIIILYFSTAIYSNISWKSLIWIINIVIFVLFGFVVLLQLGWRLKSEDSLLVLYYIYPWFLVVVKTGSAILNTFSEQVNQFYLQSSMFLSGITYGMVLSVNSQTVQFWYLIVLLTIQIISTRFQFLVNVCNILLKRSNSAEVEPQCSGYSCINSFHLFIFVYIICSSHITSFYFPYSLDQYIKIWYLPLLVWVFFSIYEAFSIIKLRNWQTLMIVGYKNNQLRECIFRCFGLVLGLWFFYIGLGIPYRIFFI